MVQCTRSIKPAQIERTITIRNKTNNASAITNSTFPMTITKEKRKGNGLKKAGIPETASKLE